jgi:hypothetical protein
MEERLEGLESCILWFEIEVPQEVNVGDEFGAGTTPTAVFAPGTLLRRCRSPGSCGLREMV